MPLLFPLPWIHHHHHHHHPITLVVRGMDTKQYDGSDIEKSVDAHAASGGVVGGGEELQRKLKNRHAQMISIGESCPK